MKGNSLIFLFLKKLYYKSDFEQFQNHFQTTPWYLTLFDGVSILYSQRESVMKFLEGQLAERQKATQTSW